jgi:hypothetical protein
MGSVGLVAVMEEKINTNKILVGRSEERRPLVRTTCG